MGCVYFIKTRTSPPVFKIGFTKTSIRRRIDSLKTGCPFELDVYSFIPGASVTTEREIHKELKQYRTKGEWFNAPVNEINKVLLQYGIDPLPNFKECVLDSGLRCLVRLDDNEVFCSLSILPGFHQTVYSATLSHDEMLYFEYDEPFINVSVLIRDYPKLAAHLHQFIKWIQQAPIMENLECLPGRI